jgi:flavin reductase (DIM6/NTAB) family NADH-FMN oxidoreductase RutF
MPHCRLGRELKVGDKVLIFATVTAVQASDEYCNVTVTTDYAMPPYDGKDGGYDGKTTITLNTKQVESITNERL